MEASVPPMMKSSEDWTMADGTQASVAEDAWGRYLVITVPGRNGPCWICAPASDRALAEVRSGRISPWVVVHHSCTGTVAIYRTMIDGSVRDSVVLCSQLPVGASVLSAA
jgi:hypothetical protein